MTNRGSTGARRVEYGARQRSRGRTPLWRGAAGCVAALLLAAMGCEPNPTCAPRAICEGPRGASAPVPRDTPVAAATGQRDSAFARGALPPAPRESLLVGGTGRRRTARPRPRADSAAASGEGRVAAGEPRRRPCLVERVHDGDTVRCRGGVSVRLLLIDAPELDQRPFGDRARRQLAALVPPGTQATLETDAQARDRYGRLLAYVYAPDGRMANEEMARAGYAVVLVYAPNGRYVERIEAAAASAAAARRGLHAEGGFACAPREHRAKRC